MQISESLHEKDITKTIQCEKNTYSTTSWAARINSAVLHWLWSLVDPDVAIGQCTCGGVIVATEALALGADNVVSDCEGCSGHTQPN